MIQVTFRIIPFTNFYQTLDSDFRFLKVLFQFFNNGWYFACFTFRMCRFALFRSLTFQVLSQWHTSLLWLSVQFFSSNTLIYYLRNLVETLCWATTRTSVREIFSGKCLPMLPVGLQLEDIAFIGSSLHKCRVCLAWYIKRLLSRLIGRDYVW